jgi:PE-PPE domain
VAKHRTTRKHTVSSAAATRSTGPGLSPGDQMAKRRARRRSPALILAGTTAAGMSAALVFGHATDNTADTPQVKLAAASTIFIDGNNYPNGSTRMAGQITGQYQYQPCTAPCTHLTSPAAGTIDDFINNTAVYPGKLGLYNGLGAPSGDQSIADGQQAIAQQIQYQTTQGNTPITVVGYSEGAVAASHEVSALGPSNNVSFVLIADPERPNGGILARLPAGTYIPLLGITGGNATSSTGAPVVMVTQQYDGIADAPAYPLNVVADANAVLGFYYLHGNYYPVNPNGAGTVVTTSPNGNMTDILVLAPQGDLPLFMPLAQAGVPQPILVALDPAVRAIIETGYDRTSDPSQQVRFALLPPVSALPGDTQAVVVGFVTTVQLLPGAVVASVPGAPALMMVAPLTTISPVSSLPTQFSLITPPAKIGEALAAMPGAIQQGESNFLTGVSSAGTAWTPLSSPVFSSASAPHRQSIVNGPIDLVADTAPVLQTPPASTNPPADPPPLTPPPSNPITAAVTNAVTNLSPFAIADRLAPNGTPSTTNVGSGTPNTTNSPGGSLVNTVTGTVSGTVTEVTGAVGGVLGGLRSATSGDGQHNH